MNNENNTKNYRRNDRTKFETPLYGRKIEFIEREDKNHYRLIFSNKEELVISVETYLEHYLYPDKVLSKSDYEELLTFESKMEYVNYLLRLLKVRNYSIRELVFKLHDVKELDYKEARRIVRIIENMGYDTLNDNYLDDFLDKCSVKGYSPSKVSYLLRNSWCDEEMVSKYLENYSVSTDTFIEILSKYLNSYSISNRLKDQKMVEKLMSLGYDASTSRSIISDTLHEIELRNSKSYNNTVKSRDLSTYKDVKDGKDGRYKSSDSSEEESDSSSDSFYLSQEGEDELLITAASKYLKSKIGFKDTYENRSKMYKYLVSKGFKITRIRDVVGTSFINEVLGNK